MLSIVIPSRMPSYLEKTVNDLQAKAEGQIEIITVFDGYWPEVEGWGNFGTVIIHQPQWGMRSAINLGMSVARGEYVMKLDEHCMFDQGYDTKLKADCEDNWVVIPRRYRLDADKWEIIVDGRPPIDSMYLESKDKYLHGAIWPSRDVERKDILIDDTMTFQGSCWFMKKSYWDFIGPLDDQNYGPFSNEPQEIGNKAWLSGGRVVVNKKTWYAHWHRDGRGYGFTRKQQEDFNNSLQKGREYSFNYWTTTKDYQYDFNWLLNKFPKI